MSERITTWKRARSLLHHVTRETNLVHVALDTGYPDSTHFSHSIRQVYGLKPRDLFAGSRQLTVLGDKLHEQRIAMMGAAKDPRADVKALVAGDKFDKTRAQALVAEKTAAVTGKSPEVIAALADFFDSLNPAQQQKVREFMDKRGRWFSRG